MRKLRDVTVTVVKTVTYKKRVAIPESECEVLQTGKPDSNVIDEMISEVDNETENVDVHYDFALYDEVAKEDVLTLSDKVQK